MMPVKVKLGDSAVILCVPHNGIFLPNALMARLNERVRVAQRAYLTAEAPPGLILTKRQNLCTYF
ncbi:MAG: hypothetical protein MUQ55_02135 [Paracoccaceae bacterium]|jgi:hypothetical protein|nr:hypothetical protein [Paracoccaceae bacterium]MDO7659158.1 hypothetical protein [Paracoccaceae bacterium]